MIDNLPDAALDADIAVLGRKGGGKTYTSKGIVERLLDMGRRVLILDPLGVWAGLRTAADGEHVGYPIAIFGGAHADLPLDTAAAPALANVIATENLPAVIDLSELTKGAQQSFLYAFLHELRRVNSEALTIVLEEADVFAPQNPQGDDSKLLHSEIDWIARRGRFRGFRLLTITQRPARLSKDVLTQCSTLIAHKLPAPQDRDAVRAWVDGNGDRDLAKEVFDTLASLSVGEAWVWAPEHDILRRIKFPKIKTLDTSSTPKAGEKRVAPKTLAQVDLTGIRAALAEASQEREAAKATEGKGKSVAPSIDVKKIEDAAHSRGLAEGRDQAFEMMTERLQVAGDNIASVLHDMGSGNIAIIKSGPRTGEIIKTLAETPGVLEVDTRTPHSTPRRVASDGTLAGAALPLLAAIARYADRGLTWDEACIVAGMISGNGYFYKGRKALIDGGFVKDGATITVTSAGLKAAGGAGAPLSLDEIVAQWAGKVGAPGAPMLTCIARQRGRLIGTDALSAAIGAKPGNGYWYRGIKSIRNPGLIDQDRDGFRLSAFLREAA